MITPDDHRTAMPQVTAVDDQFGTHITEAINVLTKKVKRVGYGFRDFDNYRLRLLLHCGVNWKTIQATPIGGLATTHSGVELVKGQMRVLSHMH